MDGSSKKDDNFIKSIKWTVRPWMMKILVHKVDRSSKKKKKKSMKDENFSTSGRYVQGWKIEWTVCPIQEGLNILQSPYQVYGVDGLS